MKKIINHSKLLSLLILFFQLNSASAQTDIDAIMMEKDAFCVGPMYSHMQWKNYWEGTLKRENLNLGTVTTEMLGVMGNYGIKKNLNFLFGASYVWTGASAGTMHGMKGVQDLSMLLKWKAIGTKLGNGKFSLIGFGGLSLPLTDYVADYLPLSIGLHSTNLFARVMGDFQQGNIFVTGSAAYIYRNNINIDRTSYYTTEMHLTNEVEMPDQLNFNFRAGYRSYRWIAEFVASNTTTLGGFDITRNNMPFPSNRMNATMVGANFKYVLPWLPQLSVVAGGSYTVHGRNVGQATDISGSLFYVFDLSHHEKNSVKPANTN